ncbi:MAG: NUDIX domain-containing protein, partial [Candidatus Zixiibacteriota bacterium]
MDHNNNQFDEAALFKRKDRHCGYQYCPLCGNELSERDLDGKPRMACRDRSCGFVFYQNPLPAAGALLVRDNEILLVKRAHPPRIGYWCIPAGFMEWHE